MYPWPQRPAGLVEAAFDELAKRWRPILDAFDAAGVDVCYEVHPGEDLHDGASFEMFLERVGNHPRANILYDPSHFVLQQLDYLEYIDLYHQRIRAFHVKDAEFNPAGRYGSGNAASRTASRVPPRVHPLSPGTSSGWPSARSTISPPVVSMRR